MEAGTSARRSDWRPSWRRVGGMAAIAAPVLMWAEFIGHGLALPGYNLLTRAASELAMLASVTVTLALLLPAYVIPAMNRITSGRSEYPFVPASMKVYLPQKG